MSLELKDFRGRITVETACILESESRATGRDRQEIVRQILHDWALQQIRIASVAHRLLQAEGLAGIELGASGRTRE